MSNSYVKSFFLHIDSDGITDQSNIANWLDSILSNFPEEVQFRENRFRFEYPLENQWRVVLNIGCSESITADALRNIINELNNNPSIRVSEITEMR